MSDDRIPIYRRFNYPRTSHTLPCNEFDIVASYERLIDPHFLVKQFNTYGCYANWGYPTLTFVGDSSMSRLLYFKSDNQVSTRVRRFLDKSYFVAVGGLKYWTASQDLNGWIVDSEKRIKYGNQWGFHDAKHVKSDYYICKAGSNDCDDLNAHLVDLKSSNCYEDYLMKSKIDIDLWLEALKPHIKNFYYEITCRDKRAYICYLPIMPRFWWLTETRRFMQYLNYYVMHDLGKEIGAKIKSIPCRSLYKIPDRCDTSEQVRDDVMTGFLEYDCVHLNIWGNEVMIHDLSNALVGNWGATVGGGGWSQNALDRRARRVKRVCIRPFYH